MRIICTLKTSNAKDHIAFVEFDEEDAVSPGFLDDFASVCREASPYMEFLTTAVGLPF